MADASAGADPLLLSRHPIGRAVLEHLRHWRASDGLLHAQFFKSDGTVCPATVRKIAGAYGVSRGLHAGRQKEVAALLDGTLRDWPPDTLPDRLRHRAAFVHDLAGKARAAGCTRGK